MFQSDANPKGVGALFPIIQGPSLLLFSSWALSRQAESSPWILNIQLAGGRKGPGKGALEVLGPRDKRAHVTSSCFLLASTKHTDSLNERLLGNTEQLWVQEEEEPGLVGSGPLSATPYHCTGDRNSCDEFLIDRKWVLSPDLFVLVSQT